jgi:hypothetical protein
MGPSLHLNEDEAKSGSRNEFDFYLLQAKEKYVHFWSEGLNKAPEKRFFRDGGVHRALVKPDSSLFSVSPCSSSQQINVS